MAVEDCESNAANRARRRRAASPYSRTGTTIAGRGTWRPPFARQPARPASLAAAPSASARGGAPARAPASSARATLEIALVLGGGIGDELVRERRRPSHEPNSEPRRADCRRTTASHRAIAAASAQRRTSRINRDSTRKSATAAPAAAARALANASPSPPPSASPSSSPSASEGSADGAEGSESSSSSFTCVQRERAWSEGTRATASSAGVPAPSDARRPRRRLRRRPPAGRLTAVGRLLAEQRHSCSTRAAAIGAPPAPASTRGNAEAGRRGRAVGGRPAGAAAPSSNERGVDEALRALGRPRRRVYRMRGALKPRSNIAISPRENRSAAVNVPVRLGADREDASCNTAPLAFVCAWTPPTGPRA